MIAQRTITSTFKVGNNTAVVEEAMRLLAKKTTASRWVCERCGMIHTGTVPDACDSCGSTASLVEQAALHREMHSRW